MSQYFGVSPWYYFADVPVKKKNSLVIPAGFYKADYPSLQYRAVHSGKLHPSEEGHRETIYYDYSIPGKNREVIRRYWRESVEMNRDYEVCYIIGMRGVHDYGFSTKVIDEDEDMSDSEKLAERIALLERIMEDQREMLPDEKSLQSFIPYKEVLDLYNAGLKVPDDVTLIWVNDNFGYIRRYSDADERKRSGGNGLYFHASYWGTPDMSYLFF